MPKILFVDDNRDFLDIASLALKTAGYDVVTAEDGIEAINKYNESSFDAVVTDIMIPSANGYELAKHVRETTSGLIPVVIGISGASFVIDKSFFDIVLQKPFFLKKLIESLRDFENKKKLS